MFKRDSRLPDTSKTRKKEQQVTSPDRTVATDCSSDTLYDPNPGGIFSPLNQSELLRSLGSSAVLHDRNVKAVSTPK